MELPLPIASPGGTLDSQLGGRGVREPAEHSNKEGFEPSVL